MNISKNCLNLIEKWEGLRLEAYLDPVGIATIGYGTIRYPTDGRKVRLGDNITEAEAEAFLKSEIDEVAANLAEHLRDVDDLNQNPFRSATTSESALLEAAQC